MTGWTIAYIGIGALLTIAVVAIVSLVFSSIPASSPVAAETSGAVQWNATPSPAPTQTGVGDPPSYDPPPYSTAVDGLYPLDDYAYFDADVSVEDDLESNWYVTSDKFGDYWLSDDPVCNLTEAAEYPAIWGDPDPAEDDGYYTEQNLDLREANLYAQFPDLDEAGDFTVTMPVSDGNDIEMAGRRLNYNGGYFLIISRAMMWQQSSYGLTISCLGAKSFDHETFAQDVADQFTLTLG